MMNVQKLSKWTKAVALTVVSALFLISPLAMAEKNGKRPDANQSGNLQKILKKIHKTGEDVTPCCSILSNHKVKLQNRKMKGYSDPILE
ncbi:MAG: hypothetical protein D6808_06630 [Candidatus Dadabacteria bacterium]|nr:MAG: hypothetical protein D6808_06630 [Candidatus Dadabacteria bacterium]